MRGPLHKFLERLWPPPTGAATAHRPVWWVRVVVLLVLVSLQLAQANYRYSQFRGWPAVAYIETSSPSRPSVQTFHSIWSYAINVVAALAVIGLTWLLERPLQARQFTLRQILGLMLCIGVFLACVREGRVHSAQFLDECGLHGAAGMMRRTWQGYFRS